MTVAFVRESSRGCRNVSDALKAGLPQISGFVEMLANEPARAEALLRESYDRLESIRRYI
jgi:hypothetical protein